MCSQKPTPIQPQQNYTKMEIKIYTSTGCGYCAKMKQLMTRLGLEYTEYRLGENLNPEQFRAIFPDASGYPRTVIDNVAIGGLTETVRYFVERGMLSSKLTQKKNESGIEDK